MSQPPLTPEQEARILSLAGGIGRPTEKPSESAIADLGRAGLTGLQRIPGAAADFLDVGFGLAGYDRPASRFFGALGEATGFQPGQWAEETRSRASPELRRQQESQDVIWERAEQDWGEGNRLKAAARVAAGTLINPRATTTMIAESIAPSLVMGGGSSLLLRKAIPALSPITAGALGQAPVIGGFAMGEIDDSVDPRRAAQAALGTTLAGTAIAGMGGALAYRLGLVDPQTAIASIGSGRAITAAGAKPYGLGKRMLGGAISEGVLQELPQESIDQMAVNWAEDKPLFEGVPRAGYEGMIAGMGMGALFNIIRPSAVNTVDVTASPPATTDEEVLAPEPLAPTDPLSPVVEQYTKLAMFERQLPRQGAEEYRQQAQSQMQRMEEQLVAAGMDPQELQLEVARKTYEDLQAKIAFAQQQGQDVRANNLTRRAQQMENIFGRDELRGPPLTVVDRLKAADEQQAQSLFTSDGQLRKPVATEYQRILSMAPATRATYLLAQLDIARMDAEQGAPAQRYQSLYQALADEYGLRLPAVKPVAQEPTDLAEGVPYGESAIGLAEFDEQQRMAEVRDFVKRVDAALRERERAASTSTELTPNEGVVTSEATLPPIPQGYTRLYRAESPTQSFKDVFDANKIQGTRAPIGGRYWTSDLAYADYFRQAYNANQDATIFYRDVPTDSLRPVAEGATEFIVDEQLGMFPAEEFSTPPVPTAPVTESASTGQRQRAYPNFQPTLPGIEPVPQRRKMYYGREYLREYESDIVDLIREMNASETGGRLVRDPTTGRVTSRTKWIQPEWYQDRPNKDTYAYKAYNQAVQLALNDRPLTLAQRNIIDYLIQVVQEQRAEEAVVAQADMDADIERAAIQTEAQPDTQLDDIPGFGEGSTTAPEGFETELTPRGPDRRRRGPRVSPDRRVSDMTLEEAQDALLFDYAMTQIPNRLAYNEAPKKAIQVSIDADSLKWINDVMGHDYGDQMITVIAQALYEETPEAYRLGGDEFVVQAESYEEAKRIMDAVRDRLSNAILTFETPDGSVITKTGIEVSYGAGTTYAEAEAALKRDKEARKGQRVTRDEQGRATGEPIGVSRTAPQRDQAGERGATAEALAEPGVEYIRKQDETPYAKESVAKGRATSLARQDPTHSYTAVAYGTGWAVRKEPISSEPAPAPETTEEVTTDAVQERETEEVSVQPETRTGEEVGQEVRDQGQAQQQDQEPLRESGVTEPEEAVDRSWHSVVENIQLDPNTDTIREALDSVFSFLDQQESPYSELVGALQDAFVHTSEAIDAYTALRGIMDVAYETEGSLSATPRELGGLRRALTAAHNYAPDIFQRALEDTIVQVEKIPVTRNDRTTRFYEDIVKAGIVDAGAGKYTSIPKEGEQYARAREIARKGQVAAGMREQSALAREAREADARGQDVAPLLRSAFSEDVGRVGTPDTDDSSGRYYIAENGAEITAPMPIGRVRAAVSMFKSRLRGATPTIHVFANQADMQAKNPDLYQQAVAARETGDFADVNAAGYSFGNGQVAIFSDRVYTQKQLNFILAHEVLGHFGMRAFFGKVEFNNLMDKVWHESESNLNFRNAVDKAMESRKSMTRQEAVEEVLADQAAIIDSSILLRVWEALKRVLERFTPIEFSDYTARYMIYQSRRYVRNRGVRLTMDADGRFVQSGERAYRSMYAEYQLSRAKKLEKRNESPTEILRKTGWEKGGDGKWRFEINDRDARYIEKGKAELSKLAPMFAELEFQDTIKTKTIPLGDVLKHSRLFAAYPEAKNIRVGLLPITDPNLGTFFRKDNVIGINQRLFMPSRYRAESKQIEVLLHELQHWIQGVEGFETGASATSNPELVFALTPKDLQVLGNVLYQEGKQFWAQHIEARNIIQAINSKPPESLKKLRKLPYRSGDSITVRKAQEAVYTDLFGDTPEAGLSVPQKIVWDAVKQGPTEQQLEAAIDQDYISLPSQQLLDGIVSGSKDSMHKYLRDHAELYQKQIYREMYYKVYGEVEARTVEIRRAWTNWQRKQKPFHQHMNDLVTDVELLSKDIILKMNGRDMAGRLRIMNNADFESRGHEISLDKISSDMREIETMQDPGMAGRFYQNNDSLGHIHYVIGQDLSSRGYDNADMERWKNKVTDAGESITEFFKRAVREIRTMNYNARDNRGYKSFFRIMASTVNYAISLRTKYNEHMSILMNPAFEIGNTKIGSGITEEQRQKTGQMAIDSTLYHFSRLTEKDVIRGQGQSEPLVVMKKTPSGGMEVTGNWEVVEKMMAHARITPEQFRKGFSYTVREVQPLSPQQITNLEAEQKRLDAKLKSLKGKERTQEYIDARDRNREITADLETGSSMVEVERKVAPRPDITKDSIEYKAYLEVQRVMAEKAIDLLAANYEAAAGERVNVEDIIGDALGHSLTTRDKKFLRAIEDNYVALREQGMRYDTAGTVVYSVDSMHKASEFMKVFNQALLAKDSYFEKTDAPKVRQYLVNMPYDDFVSEMKQFRQSASAIRASGENHIKYMIQHRVQDLALFEMRKNDAELLAKRTIMGNYIPLGREGRFQVRIQAVDMNGKEVAISHRQRSQLIYMQMNNRGEANRTAEEITKMMSESSENNDGVFQTEVIKDGRRIMQPVKLVARVEVARTKPGIHSEVNLNEVLSTLSQFNIQLTPQERASITIGLTAQNAKARTRLHREGTPGYDVKNWHKYVSQDLETAASVIARRKHRHLLDHLLDTTNQKSAELWYGSQKKYNELKDRYERLSNDPSVGLNAVEAAKREFMDYHYTFVIKDSQHEGNRYLDRAQMDLSFLEEQTSVEYTDFASGDLASRVRMATTFAQLGGSAATSLLNLLALATNVMPFLASYNDKKNFGGGFGVNAVTEMMRVGKIAAPGSRAFAPFYENLLDGYNFDNPESTDAEHVAARKRLAAEGLTPDEAVFMRDQIQAGVMQAALFNAMLGSARGRLTTGFWQRTAQGWMWMFSHSEQSARRITGLAAYRLARNRALKSGKKFEVATAEAKDFAISAINDTLGEYAMFNRPSLFRGGIQQFIFMYKMFPLTSLLLFNNMNKSGKLLMLGMLMTLAGAKGLPLGDDLMDLIDTIAQRAGLGPRGVWKGSAEKTMVRFFESIFGKEMTPWIMRGLVNNIMPANLSDRVSLSDFVPGTGIGLYGADKGREMMEVAGPFASFIADSAGTATRLTEWGLGKAGIRPETTTFMSVVRQSPFTMFRAAADSLVYADTGKVFNQKGQVVTEDVHWGTVFSRLLGFYPAAAVREYDLIRTMSRTDGFHKEIVALHRQRWLAAKITGDHELAREIEQQVRDWNEYTRGTEFEIRNFIRNSYRALRTARMTASERYRQRSPIAQRPHVDEMMELLGATD